MVGEEQRGEPGRRPGGFRLPAVNWAMAAEADAGEQEAESASAATAVLPAPAGAGTASATPTGARTAATTGAGAGAAATTGAGAKSEAGAEPENASTTGPASPAAPTAPAAPRAATTAPAAPAAPEAVALAAVEATEPVGEGAADPGPRPGKVSRPMIAAAVAVGLVLVGTSVVVTQLGGNDPKHGPAQADAPPGYGQSGGDGGNGFVPGFDEHGGSTDPAGPPPEGQPGAAVPLPVTSASAAPGDQPASAPNGAGGAGGSGGSGGGGGGEAAKPGAANPAPANGSSTGGAARSQGGSSAATGGSGSAGGSGGANPAPNPPVPNQPAPNPPVPNQPAPQQTTPAAAKPPAPVIAVAGPYCKPGGVYKANGWFDQGDKGWRNNSGGYSGDGCNGSYVSMPMSGDANKDDNGNSVVWTFTLDKVSSCTLSVYIPSSGDVKQVGGSPSYYTVQSGGGQVGSFSINQTASRGSWVNQGPFSYRGPISVTLHSRGLDWSGGTTTFAHHAASAVRATCTA
ncbi:hypothetical protein ACIQOW_14330 [Kitasatospora sp. NPDC091335]|uniref:hypothetical protein n=1 Tax=Kitasatospora sp. NPDC091335 TaxID=3364085 RepID=UPI0038197EC9